MLPEFQTGEEEEASMEQNAKKQRSKYLNFNGLVGVLNQKSKIKI
jgi:hypothetical protein